MKLFVLLSTLLFSGVLCQGGNSTTSSTTAVPTTTPGQPEPAIIQGEPVAVGEIPYQAALFRRNGDFLCGGSLIRPNMVLTAAHCIPEDRFLYVGLGGNHWTNQPYLQAADRYIIHEGYPGGYPYANDVAVLRLPSPASGPTIGLVNLVGKDAGPLANVPVRASGYGYTQNTGNPSPTLLKVNLQTITNEECRQSSQTFWQILQPTNICARYTTDYRQAVCHGDSGGPLVMTADGQDVQIGVVSFASGQNQCNFAPQAYARVSDYRDWIENAVNQLNAA